MNRPLSFAFAALVVGVPAMSVMSSQTPAATAKAAPRTASKTTAKAATIAYTPENVKAGQEIFTKRCFACHSVAEGETRLGPSLYHEMTSKPPKKNVAQMREQIINGKNKMPPFKDILTPEEIDKVIAYVHSL